MTIQLQMGMLSTDENRPVDAAEHFSMSMEEGEKLVSRTRAIADIHNLFICYANLGILHFQQEEHTAQAKSCFPRALEMGRYLDDHHPAIRAILIVSWQSLGEIYQQEGDLRQAKEHCLKALDLAEGCTEKLLLPQLPLAMLLPELYSTLEQLCADEGDTEGAREYAAKRQALTGPDKE